MVKVLQKKFIVTAMAAVSVLLLVLIGAINTANCWISSRQTSRQLEMLADTEKQMMERDRKERENWDFRPPVSGDKGSFFDPPIDEDMAMSLRFFTVCLDKANQVVRKDTSRIASVSGEEAQAYAQQVAKKEQISGYLYHFKYQVLIDDFAMEGKTVIFLDVSRQFQSIWMVAVLSVGVAVICWLCMLLLVVILSRRAIRPIAQNMLKQRQFVTDAGHELKTPLAVIQANIDAMELINGENKWSRNIRSQTIRLSGLMQNLLTLAKMDEESLLLPMTDFALGELVEESIQPFHEALDLKNIHMEADIAADVFIHANRGYMQRLLSILLDNAVKYTNDEGRISVQLKKAEKAAVLQIKNSCEELPKEDAEKLFDRFYRGDRARTQKNGGYGIGLSAAYAIVKAHKGDISARYTEGNTIIFTVRIKCR